MKPALTRNAVMKDKWIRMYLDIANRISCESHAVRLKVGAVFVSYEGIMSIGINGLPAGGSNVCEDKPVPGTGVVSDQLVYELKTLPEVSHAEENLFAKMLREGVSSKGGSIFLTHSPCLSCAKIISESGITNVYYSNVYRSLDGILLLRNRGISCIHFSYCNLVKKAGERN